MPLMGSLFVGASGLQTSQNALNTTAHNMSNLDTIGYTRQQVQLGTRFYNTISKSASAVSYQQVGLGVVFSQTKQVRDIFLDQTYRREIGRSSYYQVSYSAMREIQDIFQELEGENFSKTIENLWSSVQDLANEPGSSTHQGVFVQRCREFLTRAKAAYNGLCEYQDNLNFQVKSQVDKINEYGEKIYELNEKILQVEASGYEKANDLKDRRNQLLDELSQMVNISYSYDTLGSVRVRIEENDFVTMGGAQKMALHEDPITGFYTPYWENLANKTVAPDGTTVVNIEGATVFDVTEKIATEANTDIGSLRSLLVARGDRRGTYKDIEDVDTYNKHISQSVVCNVMAEFDQLVNKVTTSVNKLFEDAANNAGAYPGSDYMRFPNGDPIQIFRVSSSNPAIGFSCGNILIDKDIEQSPSLLSFIKKDGQVDHELANKFKELFTDEIYTLNPNVETTTNFINYYNSLIGQIGGNGDIMEDILKNQEITVEAAGNAREQVTGVSSDEELSNMIMFQNAYNASSRYINVISEMLEHIISTLGT